MSICKPHAASFWEGTQTQPHLSSTSTSCFSSFLSSLATFLSSHPCTLLIISRADQHSAMQLALGDGADEVRRPASFSGTAPTKKSTPSRSRSLPDLSRTGSVILNKTHAASSNDPAERNDVRTAAQRGRDADYDYLGKVKSLCDGIGSSLYDELFERHFTEGRGHALFIHNHAAETVLFPKQEWSTINENLLKYRMSDAGDTTHSGYAKPNPVRFILDRGQQEDPCILIVEDIDKEGIKMLGGDLGIDPCFFAQHLGQKHLVHSRGRVMTKLRSGFLSFLESRDQGSVSPCMIAGPYVFANYLGTSLSPRLDAQHPGSFRFPRISCCQISPYGCMVSIP